MTGDELGAGELRVGGDERHARRLLFEQPDGFGGEREVATLAEPQDDMGEQNQRPRLGVIVTTGAETNKRLLARQQPREGGRPGQRRRPSA